MTEKDPTLRALDRIVESLDAARDHLAAGGMDAAYAVLAVARADAYAEAEQLRRERGQRITIELDTELRDIEFDHPARRKAYIRQLPGGSWSAVCDAGIPRSFSTYAGDGGTRLKIALEACTTADEALEAVRRYCYPRFAKHARIFDTTEEANAA